MSLWLLTTVRHLMYKHTPLHCTIYLLQPSQEFVLVTVAVQRCVPWISPSLPLGPWCEVNTFVQCAICKTEPPPPMHEFNIFYSFWFPVLHTALSSFLSPSLILYYVLSDHLRIQMKSNGPWFACTYRILHVQCLLLKAWRRGWWCWWASMCSPIDIKQSSDMEMGGQGKNDFSLRLCLDVGQGLSLPFSAALLLSLSFSHHFPHFPHLSSLLATLPVLLFLSAFPSSIWLIFLNLFLFLHSSLILLSLAIVDL